MTNKEYIVRENQSLTDIAMQLYGCYEGVFVLMRENNIQEIAFEPAIGTTLFYTHPVEALTKTNQEIVNHYQDGKQVVVSENTTSYVFESFALESNIVAEGKQDQPFEEENTTDPSTYNAQLVLELRDNEGNLVSEGGPVSENTPYILWLQVINSGADINDTVNITLPTETQVDGGDGEQLEGILKYPLTLKGGASKIFQTNIHFVPEVELSTLQHEATLYKTTDIITHTLEASPISVNTTYTEPSCNGFTDGTATANPQGGIPPYSYQWNDDASQITQTAENLAAGDYEVIVSDVLGNFMIAQVQITEPEELIVIVSGTKASSVTASDGTATATPSGGTNPYTYLWNDPEAQTTPTAVDLEPGIYSVQVTDINGCTIQANYEVGFLLQYNYSFMEAVDADPNQPGVGTVSNLCTEELSGGITRIYTANGAASTFSIWDFDGIAFNHVFTSPKLRSVKYDLDIDVLAIFVEGNAIYIGGPNSIYSAGEMWDKNTLQKVQYYDRETDGNVDGVAISDIASIPNSDYLVCTHFQAGALRLRLKSDFSYVKTLTGQMGQRVSTMLHSNGNIYVLGHQYNLGRNWHRKWNAETLDMDLIEYYNGQDFGSERIGGFQSHVRGDFVAYGSNTYYGQSASNIPLAIVHDISGDAEYKLKNLHYPYQFSPIIFNPDPAIPSGHPIGLYEGVYLTKDHDLYVTYDRSNSGLPDQINDGFMIRRNDSGDTVKVLLQDQSIQPSLIKVAENNLHVIHNGASKLYGYTFQ